MSWTDMIGYAASAAVLATFCMTNMFHLRLLALASNVLFICFGALTHVYPVLLLHMALLPINLARLLQAQAPGATARTISPQLRQEDLAVSARPKRTQSRAPAEFSAFGTGAARWNARFTRLEKYAPVGCSWRKPGGEDVGRTIGLMQRDEVIAPFVVDVDRSADFRRALWSVIRKSV